MSALRPASFSHLARMAWFDRLISSLAHMAWFMRGFHHPVVFFRETQLDFASAVTTNTFVSSTKHETRFRLLPSGNPP